MTACRKNILVTGVGGDIGQSVLKCLKDTRYGLRLAGCDIDPYSAGKSMVPAFFAGPGAADGLRYRKFIEKKVREENIGYIIPTTEAEIVFFDASRVIFGKSAKVFITGSNIIKTCLDKYATALFLKNAGFLYPKTYLLDEYNGELPFPVLLKQRRGCGAKGMMVARDNDEISFYKERLKDIVVQEIIGVAEDEYTMGVFSTGSDVHSIAFRRRLGYGSLSKYAELVNDKKLERLACDVARALSLTGSINIQLRKTAAGYVPFEINPRFSSTVYLRHFFGFQDVKWWIDMEEGHKVTFNPKYKKGVAVRTIGEVFFNLKRAR
ncbi:MAG: ATP-grasp domain-containing protein [Candidatus Omnitrophica bacterium]|nr:ATP-grasp domain-containing protein [Candidatus Omnitrophota bacterium]MBU1808351.1 ATP-grasp domain-containing protein [Candidatus Omnitrophota bacterium]